MKKHPWKPTQNWAGLWCCRRHKGIYRYKVARVTLYRSRIARRIVGQILRERN